MGSSKSKMKTPNWGSPRKRKTVSCHTSHRVAPRRNRNSHQDLEMLRSASSARKKAAEARKRISARTAVVSSVKPVQQMSCPSRPVLTQSVSAIPVTSNSSSSIPPVPCRRQAAVWWDHNSCCSRWSSLVLFKGNLKTLTCVLWRGKAALWCFSQKTVNRTARALPVQKSARSLTWACAEDCLRNVTPSGRKVWSRTASGCCDKSPHPGKSHVSACTSQERVTWGHAAAKHWLTKSKMGAFSNPHVWLHLKYHFPFPCCLWQSDITVLLQCQESR